MSQFTVTISDVEEKALLVHMIDIQKWLDNMVQNRTRKAVDQIVDDYSDMNIKTASVADKEQFVQAATLETAAEREAELKKE